MNSCEPISMTGTPASLWKCGTTLSAIVFTLGSKECERNQHDGLALKAVHHIGGEC
jgi:hypothetical protein